MKKIFSFSFDEALVEEIDDRRGNMNRSMFIERLLRGLLAREEEEDYTGYA